MTATLLTPAARRHIALLGRAVKPMAANLERRFLAQSRGRGAGTEETRRFERARLDALAAIAPSAASRCRTLDAFLEQVESNGRRLAKLNLTPAETQAALSAFDALLPAEFEGRFEPAREQLRLATTLTLNKAYYDVREEEAQALFSLYRVELESEGLEELLHGYVRALTRVFGARAARFVPISGAGAGRLSGALYVKRGSHGEGLIASDLAGGRHACYWSYPVGAIAALQFGFSSDHPWLPRELSLLGAAAQRCLEASERARLRSEVRRLDAEARKAEEEERRRIGRELHDEAGQSLLFLRLQLEMLEREAPAPLAAKLRAARGVAEGAVVELRRVVAALSPAVLEQLGLNAALRHLAERFRKAYPAELSLRIPSAPERLPRQTEEVIYRVAQECFNNIAKHSQATRVMLSLRSVDRRVRLRVADNGAGFCTETGKNKPLSFGLAGMRERAALLGGALAIRSAPGKGAMVLLEIPRAAASVARHVEDSCTTN
jgi:signal transduction histidine kinase